MRLPRLVILDRDGVLNVDTGYPHRPEQIVWIDGVMETLSLLRKSGVQVVVATNQSGVGRGLYSEQDLESLHDWMAGEVRRQGGEIKHFYSCPFHPDASVQEYRRDSGDRKPAPGMLLKAMRDCGVLPEDSIMIGDRMSDMEAASRAGVKGLRFEGGNLYEFVKKELEISGGSLA